MAIAERSGARPEVPPVLGELRGRIRRYVVLEGSALVLVVLAVTFWLSLAIDWLFEPSRGVRQALLLVALAAIAAAGVWYVVLRLVRDFRSRALALVLERRFPELNDRLITAVELSERRQPPSGLTAAMLQRTADEAAELSRKLELREVFNVRPLVRAMAGAVAGMVAIAAFGLASPATFSTWFRRSVLLADEYYRRETDMRVFVLADPGERVVEFRDGVYKHPRGADLTFLAEVVEGKKVPDKVQFSYRHAAARGGGGDYMTKIGQQQFRQKLAALHQSIDLWIQGGDFSTRRPLRIEVVEPPQIERLALEALYPAYTGLDPLDEKGQPQRQSLPVLGAQISLPAGTDFLLKATINKPLRSLRIQTEGFEIDFGRGSTRGTLTTAPAVGETPRTIDVTVPEPPLREDGRELRVPFALAVAPAPERVSAEGRVHVPFPLEPDPVLRITLHDEDDVVSGEPVRLAVSSIADVPPQVETRLKGIGNSITRQATIPVVGEARDPQDAAKVYGVTDDYGVAEARFEYKLEAAKAEAKEATYQSVPFANPPEGRRQVPVDEKFKVLPLDLVIGQRITLKVVAVDGDNLTGPHAASGTPYNFQVVSDDELLALVAVKELNIRRRFEQILEEVRNTRKDLMLHRTRLEEVKPLRTEPASAGREGEIREQLNAAEFAAAASVDRSIEGIRKNANETQSIEVEFGDIRDELENNAVPDVKVLLERIDQGIIKPLHSINVLDYNNVDESLVLLRKVLEDRKVMDDGADPFARFDESIDQISLTIQHLEAVLSQMLKLETVNEALQMLRDIIKSQEDLQEKTRQERKKKLIEGLQ
ncbi:MAG: hypothetical protein ACM3U2_06395 [Deltaproteobacteria bacterium]